MNTQIPSRIRDAARLAALRRTALLDTPPEPGFDRLTRFAVRVLNAPVSLLSLVDDRREFLKSCTGLPEPWRSLREMPLSLSLCRDVVVTGRPLVIEDVRAYGDAHRARALEEVGIRSYAGFPISLPGGELLGALCVMDHRPRAWSGRELSLLGRLARAARAEVGLRVLEVETGVEAEAAETPFRALVERSLAGIYLVQDEVFAYVNPRLAEIFGYAQEEVVGRPILELVAPADRARVAENVRRRIEREVQTIHYTFRGVRRDGRVVEVEALGTRTWFGGCPAVIGTLLDVTERRSAERERLRLLTAERRARIGAEEAEERARRLAEARDRVLGIVSHDLRNPLNTIQLVTSVLLETDLTEEERRRHLEAVLRSVRSMDRLIQDLLEVARIEAGTLGVDRKSRKEPAEILGEAEEVLRPLAEERGQRLECRVEGELPRLHVDPERLQQVLSNFAGNAFKFAPAGSTVTLSAEAGDGGVRFSVSDEGPGIPEEHLPHLFDRFWQAERTGRAGAGLGLAIARGIVEAHGGTVGVESREGEGTTFHFTLPAG